MQKFHNKCFGFTQIAYHTWDEDQFCEKFQKFPVAGREEGGENFPFPNFWKII